MDIQVFFSHKATPQDQAAAGFGVEFEWDIDLTADYPHQFLKNVAKNPDLSHFFGCDTPEIKKLIEDQKFDAFMVNGWYLKSYWQAVLACRKQKIPVCVRSDSQLLTPRSPLKKILKYFIYSRIFTLFDGCLYVGKRAKTYFQYYGVNDNKLFHVPHFVNNQWFKNKTASVKAQAEQECRALKIPEKTIKLLFVGKFINKKRPQDILAAATLLKQQKIDVSVIFVGSGPLEKTLKEITEKTSFSVHFVGFKNQTQLPLYYAMADLLILPSDGGETWGLVVNEAMACGLPAIVSDDAGCMPDLIETGVTGDHFPLGDVNALAAAIKRMIPLLNTETITHAIEAKISHYSVEKAVDHTYQTVDQLQQTMRR